MISDTAIIYPDVQLGEGVTIEDFCIIGCPFKGSTNEKTIIGDHAVIRSHTVIYAGNVIGNNFQTGNKANIRELNTIGNDVSVGTLTVIEHHVNIKEGVRIHSQAFIPEYSDLGRNAWIGPNVVFTNAKYPQSEDAKNNLRGPEIGENARIGANTTLLPGIKVGRYALIGAGSVVTKNIGDAVIAYGNPAKEKGEIEY